jgi:uncharacterized membrane protein YhaH (DUF805 family)
VSFQGSIQVCLSKYLDFSGRATRPEFWWFFLFTVLVSIVSSVLDSILGTGDATGGLIQAVTGLALLFPTLAVGARRLHDIGRSGWWQAIGIIPCIGLLVLIYWWVQDGHREANQYGAPLHGGLSPA